MVFEDMLQFSKFHFRREAQNTPKSRDKKDNGKVPGCQGIGSEAFHAFRYSRPVEGIDKSSRSVAAMFGKIAPRYDLVNHVLSGNSDRRWRRDVAARLAGRPGPVLDLATGTGDLLAALERQGIDAVGADFCLDMLAVAARKSRRLTPSRLTAADAMALPFRDESFDAVTVAFGVRNFSNLRAGLAEIFRILRPGGRLVLLEFSRPSGIAGLAYRAYRRTILPLVGGLLSGNRSAYRYLDRTVAAWPDRDGVGALLRETGFDFVSSEPRTLGVVALHEAVRP